MKEPLRQRGGVSLPQRHARIIGSEDAPRSKGLAERLHRRSGRVIEGDDPAVGGEDQGEGPVGSISSTWREVPSSISARVTWDWFMEI